MDPHESYGRQFVAERGGKTEIIHLYDSSGKRVRRSHVRRSFVSIMLALTLVPRPAAAQEERIPPTPGWVGEFTMLSANALLGGITAGVRQELSGGSFQDGFVRGFLGGGVVYGGKRLAVERFAGAGLAGREVAAVGASMIRNAGEGVPSLSWIALPLGPMHVYIDRGADPSIRAKVDLNSLAMIGYAATRDELDFDAGASLSAGAPVFSAREFVFGAPEDSIRAAGQVIESVVFMSDLPWRGEAETSEIFGHERVHILQRDQLFVTIAEPFSAWLFEDVLGLGGVYRYVDLHATGLIFGALRVPFHDYESRPWELEAFHLMGR